MSVVICLTNRRDLYVRDALTSLRRHVTGWDRLVLVDDSGDADWRTRLAEQAEVVHPDEHPAGYTAAMRTVWDVARTAGGRFFLLEEDFRFTADVDLTGLHAVLDDDPSLAQIALRRAPWYPSEHRHGLTGAQFRRVGRQRGRPVRSAQTATHLRHDAGITGNPSLWSTSALTHDWPDVAWSETAMGERLRAAGLLSAWYGQEGDIHVEHVGSQRSDTSGGY